MPTMSQIATWRAIDHYEPRSTKADTAYTREAYAIDALKKVDYALGKKPAAVQRTKDYAALRADIKNLLHHLRSARRWAGVDPAELPNVRRATDALLNAEATSIKISTSDSAAAIQVGRSFLNSMYGLCGSQK